ncbi:MAG: mechanosensitive ion channel [Pirellulaceae bacterium]|nr:mechanosensitive ion channel [Pirellulaceae bacterium]
MLRSKTAIALLFYSYVLSGAITAQETPLPRSLMLNAPLQVADTSSPVTDAPLQVADAVPALTPAAAPASLHSSSAPVSAPLPTVNHLASNQIPVPDPNSSAVLQEKQQQVASQLRVALLQEQAKQTTDSNDTDKPTAEATDVDLLKQKEVTIAQQKTAAATLEDTQTKLAELETEFNKLADNRLDVEPPYSILLLDQLNDSLNLAKARKEASEASLIAARDSVERAKLLVENQQKAYRQLKEKIVGEEDPKLRAAKLEIELAEELLVLRRQEASIEEAGEAVRAMGTKIDEKKLDIVRRNVQFSKETLNLQLAEIDARENEIKRRVAALQTELEYAEKRWLAARQDVDSTSNPGPELIEKVEALKSTRQTIQLEQSVLNQQLQRLPTIRTAWERRYIVVAGTASREERRVWVDETEQQLDALNRERRAREFKINEVRVALATVDAKIDAVKGDNPDVRRWLESKQDSLAKQIEIYSSSILAIENKQRTLNRLLVQIQGRQGRGLNDWAADTWAAAQRAWNYEITNIDDFSLTVGKILNTILLLFIGYFAAGRLSGWFGRRLPKLGVDEAGANAIESLMFYALVVGFALAALRYAHVPLTAFTFLGGAIAIGIGFGSQNVVNNFISGLILLAERPIKVGDLVLLDEVYGNITQIGARSTQIRTGENLDIIVPNSKFLENNVINLTRRDDRLRTSISVGVAYGSPLNKVVELLEKAAADHGSVHIRPKPFVWFNDFGDNSLMFQVHFWINARSMAQMKKVETDVRLTIDRLFREHEIVIAFPQRDLHIQTPNPIQLRLINDDQSGADHLRAA